VSRVSCVPVRLPDAYDLPWNDDNLTIDDGNIATSLRPLTNEPPQRQLKLIAYQSDAAVHAGNSGGALIGYTHSGNNGNDNAATAAPIWLGMVTSNLRDPLRRIIPGCNHSIPVSLLWPIIEYIRLSPHVRNASSSSSNSTVPHVGWQLLNQLDNMDTVVGNCWRVSNVLPLSPASKFTPKMSAKYQEILRMYFSSHILFLFFILSINQSSTGSGCMLYQTYRNGNRS
jgi:hypothetical protein